MKKVFFISLLVFGLCICSGQGMGAALVFNYDNAGNQIQRKYRTDITAAPNNRNATGDDYVKFHPEDDFSYYPNPVKDVLQLQWQTKDRFIKEMVVYNLNGQALQRKTFSKQDVFGTINLADYTKGTYMLHIIYSDDDVASIKILKN